MPASFAAAEGLRSSAFGRNHFFHVLEGTTAVAPSFTMATKKLSVDCRSPENGVASSVAA